jgi:CarD family transcriptional regulator
MSKAATMKKTVGKSTAHKKAPGKAKAQKPANLKLVTKNTAKAAAKAVKPVAKMVAKKPVHQAPRPAPAPVKPVIQAVLPVAKLAPKPLPVVKKLDAMKAYKVGHYVVYPTHGVGRIMAEETQQVSGSELRMLVILFDKDRMTLRVPVHRAQIAGLRHVCGGEDIQKVLTTLKGRARISRGMWSRRAQEYEAKINSGNILSIAEVVRDLHHNVDQAERSYSERMIYESALGRLVGELAAAEAIDHKSATDRLMKVLRAKIA